MRLRRTLPPTAAFLGLTDLWHGLFAIRGDGSELSRREAEFSRFFDTDSVFLVSSGKAALSLTLQSLQVLSPGRRAVLVPAYTCWSVPSAVVGAGCEVRLCDIDPTTLDYDRRALESAITPDLLCVVVQHLLGLPADVAAVLELCRRKGIWVVEDAAQAMGVTWQSRKLGTVGDAGFFSLGRGKNITCGSGGIVVTRNRDIARVFAGLYARLPRISRARQLAEWVRCALMAMFINPSLYWLPAGLPFLGIGGTVYDTRFGLARLSPMQAGLLHSWERSLDSSNAVRMKNAERLAEGIGKETALPQGIPCLRYPFIAGGSEHRSRLLARSGQQGLGMSAFYPAPVDQIPELKALFSGERSEGARLVAERLVTLPTHHFVSESDVKRILAALWP